MKTNVNSAFTHRHRALAFIVCILLLPICAAAQNHSILYETPDDVKHYTTKIIPDGSGSVMAGTILKSLNGGQNAIHFIRQDNVGNVIVSRQYNSGYSDERAVDIAGYEDAQGVTRWYITCLSRDAGAARDRIKVICVNNNGMILGQRTYQITLGSGTRPVTDLYPTNSLIWHPNEPDMSLFICGHTKGSAGDPNYNMDKDAFVIRIDITQGSTHLVEYPMGHLYGSSKGPGSMVDYDMALRMVQEEGSDNIFVTGSVNSTTGSGIFPDVYNHHSAVMNLVIDPNTLVPIYYHPFTPGGPNGDLNNAGALCYGVDLIQSGGQNYILFNFSGYGPYPWSAGPSAADMMPRYGKIWAVAPLNGLMDPFDYSPSVFAYNETNRTWASTAMEANGRVTVGTQTAFDFMWCDDGTRFPWRPEFWNVVTSLMEFNLPPTGGPNTIQQAYYMADDITFFQTGDPAAGINNSFWEAGGIFSNIDYAPTFVDRYNDGTFAMNSPRHLNNKLYIKYQNPDPSLNIDCGMYTCANSFKEIPNRPASSTLEDGLFIVVSLTTPQNSVGSTYSIVNGLPCEDAAGNPHWKTTGIEDANITPGGINIYPNPASTEVHIAVGNAFAGKDATIQVELANAMGQVVTSLYNGKADGLTASKALALPQLASGIYTVKITSNGEVKYNSKLTIQ